jgi:hypothetical protein
MRAAFQPTNSLKKYLPAVPRLVDVVRDTDIVVCIFLGIKKIDIS